MGMSWVEATRRQERKLVAVPGLASAAGVAASFLLSLTPALPVDPPSSSQSANDPAVNSSAADRSDEHVAARATTPLSWASVSLTEFAVPQ